MASGGKNADTDWSVHVVWNLCSQVPNPEISVIGRCTISWIASVGAMNFDLVQGVCPKARSYVIIASRLRSTELCCKRLRGDCWRRWHIQQIRLDQCQEHVRLNYEKIHTQYGAARRGPVVQYFPIALETFNVEISRSANERVQRWWLATMTSYRMSGQGWTCSGRFSFISVKSALSTASGIETWLCSSALGRLYAAVVDLM